MTKERAEQLGQLADKIDNLVSAMELPFPVNIHLNALKGSLPEISDELKKIVKDETGENPWESWEDSEA